MDTIIALMGALLICQTILIWVLFIRLHDLEVHVKYLWNELADRDDHKV